MRKLDHDDYVLIKQEIDGIHILSSEGLCVEEDLSKAVDKICQIFERSLNKNNE